MHRKTPCGAGLRPQEQFDWKKLSDGRTAISPLKLDTGALLALCLLARCLTDFDFGSLSYKAPPQPYTTWLEDSHRSPSSDPKELQHLKP